MNCRILIAMALSLATAACAAVPDLQVRPLPTATSGAPQTPFDAAYQEGKRHLAADHLGLAIVMFDKALTINPRSVPALNACGAAYDDLHRFDVAHAYYSRALAIDPNSMDTWNNMAVSALMAHDFTTAKQYLAKAITLDPGNEIVRNNLRMLADATEAAPRAPPSALSEADRSRPIVERTGENELTLVVHPLPGREAYKTEINGVAASWSVR